MEDAEVEREHEQDEDVEGDPEPEVVSHSVLVEWSEVKPGAPPWVIGSRQPGCAGRGPNAAKVGG